ncbi:MAG: NAD(P)-binding protein [Candidatus Aminicenantes bacterium]|nr:NAD(P)-binding protein [Candidatus Aminicenantes bacterium]NIM83400.1 NAD(P)-binding protein [Candidatus Aminicenantes bacterium]NIN22792.1 NAD(P)-binding protein [Candidatus Aminicenantes bacterium]NIN46526.1 NAD(P)-binding protein [Candidatus Aminicenantes bacterium]NIN89431.1 NAD(P)-binding protein [Candidatus Aminicenantes bacterium]
MGKKINIIGAGLAGLSAGCYLEMNGYDTEIFELHTMPGGLCTSWKRGDYIFDGCIDFFYGTNPAYNFYHIWNELIDMKRLEIFHYPEYRRIEDKNGQFIRVLTNLDELEQELLEKAPEDRAVIAEFIGLARKFLTLSEMPNDKAPDSRGLKKWDQILVSEFTKKCKNPLLAKTIGYIFAPEVSVSFLMMLLVSWHQKNAGYPIGGSLKFSRLIEKRYLELGGKIHYNSRVKKILTKDNSAKGVLLENGKTYPADIVISAADGYTTIFEMLEGKYTDEKILNAYENCMPTPSFLLVSLGISRTFPEVPHRLIFPLEKTLVIDPVTSDEDIMLRVFGFDPTVAPEGKTVINCFISTGHYKYWVDLRENNREKYKQEKNRIADEVIDILEKRFGNVKSHVEVTDVCTPASVIRYTNNWQGSIMGWWYTIKNVLPGLEDFYMAGQWIDGGGLSVAIESGRNVAQIICKKDKKKFTTSHY